MKIFTLILLLLISIVGKSQVSGRDPSQLITGTGYLNVRTIKPELEGKTELFPEFKQGTVYVNKSIEGVPFSVNFDLYDQVVLIRVRNQLFEMKIDAMDSVKIKMGSDSTITMINLESLSSIQKKAFGSFLFKKSGMSLVKEFNIEVIKPTYNELMNVGNRNYVITQSTKYYFRKTDSEPFKRISLKKKQLLEFTDSKEQRSLVNQQKCENESDFVRILNLLATK